MGSKKILYIDSKNSGIAGDMYLSALSGLSGDDSLFDQLISTIRSEFPDIEISTSKFEEINRMGIHPRKLILDYKEGSHDHHHGHTDEHSHEHNHEHSHSQEHTHNHTHTHPHEHTHEASHADSESHSHQHNHEHNHGHDHEHNHGHDHEHNHANHTHSHDHPNEHSHKPAPGINHHHHHDIQSMRQKMENICNKMSISDFGRKFAINFLNIIAEAEGNVHQTSPDKVHLHEIGSIDTVIDVCGITMYLDRLGFFKLIQEHSMKIMASPIAVGGGTVKIAHGVVTVPAPATTAIFKKYNIPIIGGPVEKELCTPTGAALIANLVSLCNMEFSQFLPPIQIEKTSISTGNLVLNNFSNILTIYLGNLAEESSPKVNPGAVNSETDGSLIEHEVAVLETTVDDVSGEFIGYMMDLLLEAGALDVNFIGVQSKKNRPGTLIRVICNIKDIHHLIEIMISELGTLGVRYRVEKRLCLKRQIITRTVELFDQTVEYRVKIAGSWDKSKTPENYKIEYDDIVNISKKFKLPISRIRKLLEKDFESR